MPPTAASSEHWRLLYYDAPTRGEQLRCLFVLAGVDFEDTRIPYPDGLKTWKRSKLGDESPLLFDQCPSVIHTYHTSSSKEQVMESSDLDTALETRSHKISISQTAACMLYVGKKLGLCPKNPEDEAKAVSCVIGAEEFRDQVFYVLFLPLAIMKFLRLSWLSGPLKFYLRLRLKAKFTKYCDAFEFAIRQNTLGVSRNQDSVCLASGVDEGWSFADVAVWDVLTAIKACGVFNGNGGAKDTSSMVNPTQFPLLAGLVARMDAEPLLVDHVQKRKDFFDLS